MNTQEFTPYCPRDKLDGALAPRRLAELCHELGQHLYAYGLQAAAIDLAPLAQDTREMLDRMNSSVHALESKIKTLHELVNLTLSSPRPALQCLKVGQMFEQLDQHFSSMGMAVSFENSPVNVLADPGMLFQILCSVLRCVLTHCGMKAARVVAASRGGKAEFSILAPPMAAPDHRERFEHDLDMEIAQILSHQLGYPFAIAYEADRAPRITIDVPATNG